MFTKENISALMPDFDTRMTPEDFEKNFSMPNRDTNFSEMLEKYSDLPEPCPEIAALSIDDKE